MKVCIHRGTQEIGGTCIEMEAQGRGRRIAFDVGLPLDAHGPDVALLPAVSGFRETDDSLEAVVKCAGCWTS